MRPQGDQKPRLPTSKRGKDTSVSCVRAPKAREIQVHFNILEDLWRRFQARLPDLGYLTASEFLRQRVRDALLSLKMRNLKEFVYDFDEFKEKVSMADPIHHSCMERYVGKEAIVYELTFGIYGVSSEGGHIIIFETKRRLDTLSKEFNEKWSRGNFHDRLNVAIKNTLDEIKKTYAAPIGSTEGRLEL